MACPSITKVQVEDSREIYEKEFIRKYCGASCGIDPEDLACNDEVIVEGETEIVSRVVLRQIPFFQSLLGFNAKAGKAGLQEYPLNSVTNEGFSCVVRWIRTGGNLNFGDDVINRAKIFQAAHFLGPIEKITNDCDRVLTRCPGRIVPLVEVCQNLPPTEALSANLKNKLSRSAEALLSESFCPNLEEIKQIWSQFSDRAMEIGPKRPDEWHYKVIQGLDFNALRLIAPDVDLERLSRANSIKKLIFKNVECISNPGPFH